MPGQVGGAAVLGSRCSRTAAASASASESEAKVRPFAPGSRQQRNCVANAPCWYLEGRATGAQRPEFSGEAPQRSGSGRWGVASARQGDRASCRLRRCAGWQASSGARNQLSSRYPGSSSSGARDHACRGESSHVARSDRASTILYISYSFSCDQAKRRNEPVFPSNHSGLVVHRDPRQRILVSPFVGVSADSDQLIKVEFDPNQEKVVSKKVGGVTCARRVAGQVRRGDGPQAPMSESPICRVLQPEGSTWPPRSGCDRR